MGVTQDFGDQDPRNRWEIDATREATYAKVIDSMVDLLLKLMAESGLWNWSDGCGGWLTGLIEEKAAEIGLPLSEYGPVHRPILIRLLERDGPLCRYCQQPTSLAYPEPHVDHVVPKARGGGNELSNLAISCPPCNMSKGAKLVEEWRP